MTNCWLYLDCQIMTGYSFNDCPNKEACKHNAQHSRNRYCFLPYDYNDNHPKYLIPKLEVNPCVDSQAKEAGYTSAIDIFYSYENNCLVIGRDKYGYSLQIPNEAYLLGFAEAEKLPYAYKKYKDYGMLTVDDKSWLHRDLGWQAASSLQYVFYNDLDIGQFLQVRFVKDISYTERNVLISLGWHPPCDWYPKLTRVMNISPSIQSKQESSELEYDPDEIPFVRSVGSITVSSGLLDAYEIDVQCPQVTMSHNFKFKLTDY